LSGFVLAIGGFKRKVLAEALKHRVQAPITCDFAHQRLVPARFLCGRNGSALLAR
jgi:hypothetical protein